MRTLIITIALLYFLINILSYLYSNKNLKISEIFFSFFSRSNLVEVFLTILIIFTYPLYFFLVFPLFFLFFSLNVSRYALTKHTIFTFEIQKPVTGSLKIPNTLKQFFFIQFYKFPEIWAYLAIYYLIKIKKIAWKAFLDNFFAILLTGRPLWFFLFANKLAQSLIKIIKLPIWKRKNYSAYFGVFVNLLAKETSDIYLAKLLEYDVILKPLRLEIKKNHINGLEDTIKIIKNLQHFVQFNQFKEIKTSGIWHFYLTNMEGTKGQVFTHSKKIWVNTQFVETTPISKTQSVCSTFSKSEQVRPILTRKYQFLTQKILTIEDYMALVYRLNLLYITDVSEKILWQDSDKKLTLLLTPDMLPLSYDTLDQQSAEFKEHPLLFMRYKIGPWAYSSDFVKELESLSLLRQEIVSIDDKSLIALVHDSISVSDFSDWMKLSETTFNAHKLSYAQLPPEGWFL